MRKGVTIMNTTENIKVRGNRISMDYEGKMPWHKRLMLRLFSKGFLTKVLWAIFRYILLIGIAYVIIFPFFTKISSSFMSQQDFVDVTVKMIPKYPTLDTYRTIIIENHYFKALTNTATLSVLSALLQTMITAFVGYGLAKFKFRGRGLVFGMVILTMIVPHSTIMFSMFVKFRYFDIFGIFQGLNSILHFSEKTGTLDLINSFWPLAILSATGLAFKNGLYIFIFRQFYKGVPDELEEAAYVDGSGVFKTYFRIILPLTVPMMTTVFMFAFSWQWTDTYYSTLFFTSTGPKLLPSVIAIPQSLSAVSFAASTLYQSAITNAAGILVILPLFIIFLFAQKSLVQGIERSGIVG